MASIQPDSAIALLKTLEDNIKTEPESTQMYYQLLCIKANDKAYIRHTSDSLILLVLHYYIEKRDERHLPEAYYYAGRVYRDLEDAPQALDYFEKAIDALPINEGYQLKSKIYSQMGTLFLYQKTYDEALKMFKEAQKCDIALKDSANMVFNLRDIADSYRCIDQNDSSIYYFQKAYNLAEVQGNQKLMAMVQNQMASLYSNLGKYDLARKLLQPSLDTLDIHSKSGIFSIASKLYHRMGYIDSASYYYNELLKCGTIYAKQTAHKGLAKIAILHDNPQKALLHLNQYIQYTDFIHQITDTENVRRLNSLYNYQLREKENNRLKIENKEKQNLIIYIISIGLFIIASLFAYLQRNKRKKQLLKIQLKNLRQLKEEQYKKSSLFIEENKRKIEELEQKLQEADQTNHILRTQLKEQIELTLYTNKQAEIELTRRKQSNSTLLESEIYKYIQKQLTTKTNKKLLSNNDWKELEKVINNTYEGFSKNLRNYYDLNEHEYSVCLLIKINIPPIDIAKLTNHSKEAITSTRRRLYEKVFGKKGSPKDWDEFILSL
nr:tetratricopeptide repeat protein [Bacteroides intestinalis]